MLNEYNDSKFAGADWLEKAGITDISDLGRNVADLLGQFELGIYHIQREVVHHPRVDWSSTHLIEIVLPGTLSTFDNSRLTTLVLLCHKAAIRCEIGGAANGYLRLRFHGRERDDTARLPMHRRHPSIEQAIADFNHWNGWHPLREEDSEEEPVFMAYAGTCPDCGKTCALMVDVYRDGRQNNRDRVAEHVAEMIESGLVVERMKGNDARTRFESCACAQEMVEENEQHLTFVEWFRLNRDAAEETVECARCDGDGVHECEEPECTITGTTTCHVCKGKGTLTGMDAARQTYEQNLERDQRVLNRSTIKKETDIATMHREIDEVEAGLDKIAAGIEELKGASSVS